MYTCSAATPTPNGTMCALTTDHTKDTSSKVRINSTTGFLSENRYSCTTDISSKTRDNSVTDLSSKNRDKSKTSINSIASSSSNNSTIDLSSKNDSSSKAKDNSTVTRKVLKLSTSKKQHSYQEHDPPIDVNHPNEYKLFSQTHPGNCSAHQVHAPQDTNRCIQIQGSKVLKDITNSVNHTKQLDNSSTPAINNPAKNPLTQGCTHPSLFDHKSFKSVLSWKQLDDPLQAVLPNDSKYTYVIEEFEPKTSEEFEGAPINCFEAVIRINLTNEEEAKQWIQDMMAHSLTTYRVTRTTTPGLKRVQCKLEMHCQHYRKSLTSKQKQAGAIVKSKKSRSPITYLNRNKKTQYLMKGCVGASPWAPFVLAKNIE